MRQVSQERSVNVIDFREMLSLWSRDTWLFNITTVLDGRSCPFVRNLQRTDRNIKSYTVHICCILWSIPVWTWMLVAMQWQHILKVRDKLSLNPPTLFTAGVSPTNATWAPSHFLSSINIGLAPPSLWHAYIKWSRYDYVHTKLYVLKLFHLLSKRSHNVIKWVVIKQVSDQTS